MVGLPEEDGNEKQNVPGNTEHKEESMNHAMQEETFSTSIQAQMQPQQDINSMENDATIHNIDNHNSSTKNKQQNDSPMKKDSRYNPDVTNNNKNNNMKMNDTINTDGMEQEEDIKTTTATIQPVVEENHIPSSNEHFSEYGVVANPRLFGDDESSLSSSTTLSCIMMIDGCQKYVDEQKASAVDLAVVNTTDGSEGGNNKNKNIRIPVEFIHTTPTPTPTHKNNNNTQESMTEKKSTTTTTTTINATKNSSRKTKNNNNDPLTTTRTTLKSSMNNNTQQFLSSISLTTETATATATGVQVTSGSTNNNTGESSILSRPVTFRTISDRNTIVQQVKDVTFSNDADPFFYINNSIGSSTASATVPATSTGKGYHLGGGGGGGTTTTTPTPSTSRYQSELPESSRLSLAGLDTTLPLAVDNERFFECHYKYDCQDMNTQQQQSESSSGYYALLLSAAQKIQLMRKNVQHIDGGGWRPGNDESNYSILLLGRLWRYILRCYMIITSDRINKLLISRNAGHSLQEHLPFLTSYESFVLGGVVKEFDFNEYNDSAGTTTTNTKKKRRILKQQKKKQSTTAYHLQLAFRNRNTSRILSQQVLHYGRWAWWYHLSTGMLYTRLFGFLSRFWNLFAFPFTENNSPHDHDTWYQKLIRCFRSMWEFIRMTPIRYLFFTVESYHDRDQRIRASMNLAAEVHGVESYNIEHYGTFLGRYETSKFRQEHRLNIDESIIRSFMSNAIGTMVHNGCEHVLRCLVKHWKNMLYQENGSFSHQRLEQLNPFDVLRVHVPEVLCTLAGLRGRNKWDSEVLGPFVRKLQSLDPGRVFKRGINHKNPQKMDDDLLESGKATNRSFVNDSEIQYPCQAAQRLIQIMKEEIVPNVTGKVPSRMIPFNEWLDTIYDSLSVLCTEAKALREFVATVEMGINIGYDILRIIDWSVPTEEQMKDMIINMVLRKENTNHTDHTLYDEITKSDLIGQAVSKLSPKDERTLRECIEQNRMTDETTILLLGRTGTLLEREIHRKALDDRIQQLSKGSTVLTPSELIRNHWYWVQNTSKTNLGSNNNNNNDWKVLTFKGSHSKSPLLKFVDSDVSGLEYVYRKKHVQILQYIPVAEAIARAQKVFMMIELDHGKRFSYNTFMEFGSTTDETSLRNRLRRLAIVGQIHCYELDRARRSVLAETKLSVHNPRKKRQQGQHDFSFGKSRFIYETKPQNVLFLGGGPSGLLGAIHCLHNVILTGGEVKVYEGRDGYKQGASAFERAQIVRLDARLVSMLRYHLGTGFEDVFTPCRGESTAHLGNSLSSQGFVEISIKRLESMLLDEVINLRSKGLLSYFSDSPILCDDECVTFRKKGKTLKVGDVLYDDEKQLGDIEVVDFEYEESLEKESFNVGEDYDIVHPRENRVRCYQLIQMDTDIDWYHFVSQDPSVKDVSGSFAQLPKVYVKGCGRTEPARVILKNDECEESLEFDAIKDKEFMLDVSKSHLILALGKPVESKYHFQVTPTEPYAICCIEGLKISKGMHNFGEKRFGQGIKDDYRTLSTSNTRVVGDFMKSVRISSILRAMSSKLNDDPVWKCHFEHLTGSKQDTIYSIYKPLQEQMIILMSKTFKRHRLQTRFFELGNTYYLGMELPREYDSWKESTVLKIAPDKIRHTPDSLVAVREAFQKKLSSHIDRLWFDATLEVLKHAFVYEVEGSRMIPRMYTIDSPFEQALGDLDELDAFRIGKRWYRVREQGENSFTTLTLMDGDNSFSIPSKTHVLDKLTGTKKFLGEAGIGDLVEPIDVFEIMSKKKHFSIVRTSGGYVTKLSNLILVSRTSDLARAPDGYSESKVSLSSFPVQHWVCHRTLRINHVPGRHRDDGFITAHIGDAQASPHFMRYSGLSGAGINCMSFSNLVGQALRGIEFTDRVQRYSFETSWSSGEVVHRGIGSGYGSDGFLRPGFNYQKLIDYMYDRVLEYIELGAHDQPVLSRDWKAKIAAGIIPRGLENDTLFYESLLAQLETALHKKFQDESKKLAGNLKLPPSLWDIISEEKVKISVTPQSKDEALRSAITNNMRSACDNEDCFQSRIKALSSTLQVVMITLKETIDFSIQLRLANQRISSELSNQPKAVDRLIDKEGCDARKIVDALTISVVLAGASTILYHSSTFSCVLSALCAICSFFTSYDTLVGTYRIQRRKIFYMRWFIRHQKTNVLKNAFAGMTTEDQGFNQSFNPFTSSLNDAVQKFLDNAYYYGAKQSSIDKFRITFSAFITSEVTETSTVLFIREMIERYITDEFHENSYLQECLVAIYKELLDLQIIFDTNTPHSTSQEANHYSSLYQFIEELEFIIFKASWYRAGIDIIYQLYLKHCCRNSSFWIHFGTIKASIKVTVPSASTQFNRYNLELRELCQSIRDFETNFLIWVSATGTCIFSALFTLQRFMELCKGDPNDWISRTNTIFSWILLFPLVGGIVALLHLKERLTLTRHFKKLLEQRHGNKAELVYISRIISFQLIVTVLQLLAIVVAVTGLNWTIAHLLPHELNFCGLQYVPLVIPFVALSTMMLAVLLSIWNEYFVRQVLDPCIGNVIYELFESELHHIHKQFVHDRQQTGLEIRNEIEIWNDTREYVAREFLHKYRFDMILDDNRFCSVCHHIQSENKKVV